MEDERSVLDDSLNSAGPTQLMPMVQRLKEEHESLKEKVTVLYTKAMKLRENLDVTMAWSLLPSLRAEVQALMKELDEHAVWEEKELFPIITKYYNLHIGPSITPSIWVLEKEHELAKQFVQSFLDVSKEVSIEENPVILPDSQIPAQFKLAAAHLLQAFLILQEHFEMEEDIIYPLVNELFND